MPDYTIGEGFAASRETAAAIAAESPEPSMSAEYAAGYAAGAAAGHAQGYAEARPLDPDTIHIGEPGICQASRDVLAEKLVAAISARDSGEQGEHAQGYVDGLSTACDVVSEVLAPSGVVAGYDFERAKVDPLYAATGQITPITVAELSSRGIADEVAAAGERFIEAQAPERAEEIDAIRFLYIEKMHPIDHIHFDVPHDRVPGWLLDAIETDAIRAEDGKLLVDTSEMNGVELAPGGIVRKVVGIAVDQPLPMSALTDGGIE